jgi:long-chain acyl-CoA synthetase
LHRAAGKKLLQTFGGELHFFGIGGAKLAPDVEQFLRDAEFPYAIGYGLTETAPLIAGSSPNKTRFRSTGPPIPGVDLRIYQPDPITGHGEIQVRGQNVMTGYYRDKERTNEVFTDDGWFRTGDLGILDEDGYLYIKGRSKNMILGPSGENIYPEEIESRINANPLVLESLVYDEGGQLTARVHLNYEELEKEKVGNKSESRVTEEIKRLLEDIREQVNASASVFARLKKIIEQPEPFEKTPTKKIKRYLYVSPPA